MSKDIINQAIENKQILEFYYDDKQRTVEPYVIGRTSKNKLSLLSIQIGGHTSSGRLPDWRMFEIDKIKDIKVHKRKFAAYFQIYQDEARRPFHLLHEIVSKALNIDEKLLTTLQDNFDVAAKLIEGKSYWLAKDLRKLLGYTKWSSFAKIVDKVRLADNSTSDIRNALFTLESCLEIAKLADYKRQKVMFARIYFASELVKSSNDKQEQVEGLERIKARMQLTEMERYLSAMMYKHGASEKDLGRIRSAGDSKLFGGLNTARIKERVEAKKNQVLSDFLPSILIKAKEFAAALTSYNIQAHSINDPYEISKEHSSNNSLVRYILSKKGIIPENILLENEVQKEPIHISLYD